MEQSFLLETGQAQMSAWFPNAILKRYDDALLVTEPQPLVDYIMSSEVLRVEDQAALTQFVQTQMVMQGGAIRITKDSGIFIASNA